ncbi:hypothetical protein [Virgibacillus sp. Bac330]|uniref:TolB family protein n=1 Tax=Virgibacillus sp. Bac330 TaxID=2419841 RepID=UPI000EF4ECD2|nr:hypothetical protein [Virgibacillus sp. Bac330]
MAIEAKLNAYLNKLPVMKKVVKRLYQLGMYAISPKIKYKGDIKRISPDDGMEYFFGYYDKSPWDITDRYMLCLRVKNSYSSVAPNEPAEIVLFDTENDNSYQILGTTRSWNVQQGCMLQWLGPDYSRRIIYNDFRDGKYCSVILNLETKQEKIIAMPVYSVDREGQFALTLDFARLHRLRPGYGYSNLKDKYVNEKCPDDFCIWHVNLNSGQTKPILKYTDFAGFEPRTEMVNAEHKVNHIMINPSGDRFMVLHRWINNNNRYTRLVTANINGSDIYNLNDDNMTSHCCWKNDGEILAFANKKNEGNGYYLMRDKTSTYQKLWPELQSDGHPSFSPDGKMVITDTYPDRKRIASVYCIKGDDISSIAKVFAPFRYDNDVRCDLHPRWSRSGNKICIDSVFERKRNIYEINVNKQ